MSNSGGILKESDAEVVGRDIKVKIVDKENICTCVYYHIHIRAYSACSLSSRLQHTTING